MVVPNFKASHVPNRLDSENCTRFRVCTTGSNGLCGQSALGQSCVKTDDCTEGACTNSKCSPLPNGAACTDSKQCSTSNVCSDGKCRVQLYQACTKADLCVTSAETPVYCVPHSESSTGSWCAPGAPAGAPCSEDTDCARGKCDKGICERLYSKAPCLSNSECYSGDCFINYCYYGAAGTQCQSTNDCLPGNTCNAGICGISGGRPGSNCVTVNSTAVMFPVRCPSKRVCATLANRVFHDIAQADQCLTLNCGGVTDFVSTCVTQDGSSCTCVGSYRCDQRVSCPPSRGLVTKAETLLFIGKVAGNVSSPAIATSLQITAWEATASTCQENVVSAQTGKRTTRRPILANPAPLSFYRPVCSCRSPILSLSWKN